MKVEVNKISFGYIPTKMVLEDISFEIESSKSVAIVGSSGCGKSTLLRIVCGILPESKQNMFTGNISINGIDIKDEKSKWQELRKKGELGFMFQESNLMPYLNVKDNIHLPLRIIGSRENDDEIVTEYLKITGLIDDYKTLPNKLSGGMKTRVALARTFITKPKLLLLDEPFSSLDIVWKSKLYEEVRKLKRQMNSTVLLVTHDIFEAMFFSNTIIVLGSDHKIVEKVIINNWNESLSYNEIITGFYKEFVYIKNLIEAN